MPHVACTIVPGSVFSVSISISGCQVELVELALDVLSSFLLYFIYLSFIFYGHISHPSLTFVLKKVSMNGY